MFTGLVSEVGSIVAVTPLADDAHRSADSGLRLRIRSVALHSGALQQGDSIAIQGACMTAVRVLDDGFEVEVSRESLARTARLDSIGPVNLEAALRMGDRLGGHLVAGHVDGIGHVVALDPVGESRRLDVRLPAQLARFVAPKGSVTIDGVSLTVNAVVDEADFCMISINLIPHTVEVTTLRHRRPGDAVNVEVDLIARHLARLVQRPAP